ncbi:MAG TPA: hypothetical protein VMW25_04315 [Clostridia bacterium]|nr:hypothetical protein [Clostridia bacterium]
MTECDFNKDLEKSKKFEKCWDEWYQSQDFYGRLQKMRLKGKVEILKVDRSDNELFQKMSYLDTVITLSTGSALLIDEKVTGWKPEFKGDFLVEVWSNPNKGGKSDGWGYHVGTTIAQAKVDFETVSFVGEPPVLYTITTGFIDNVTREIGFEKKYRCYVNASTGGLYKSGFGPIKRNVLEAYWP